MSRNLHKRIFKDFCLRHTKCAIFSTFTHKIASKTPKHRKIYPKPVNLTQALLVMLLTFIMSGYDIGQWQVNKIIYFTSCLEKNGIVIYNAT